MPSLVDIAAVIVLVIGVLQGIRRRFSGELARFIATIVVFAVGLVLFQPVGVWLQEHSRLEARGALAVGFLIVIVASIVLSIAICFVVSRLVRLVLAPPADRFLGALAGLLRAAIFVLLFFILMNLWPHEYVNHIFGEASMIGRCVTRFLPEIEEVVEERREHLTTEARRHRGEVYGIPVPHCGPAMPQTVGTGGEERPFDWT